MDVWYALLSWKGLCVSVLVVIVSLVYSWYRSVNAAYTFFAKQGINGPKPEFFFGNSRQMKDIPFVWQSWEKKYGKVCGYYQGVLPHYLISDISALKQVMIKEFDHFVNRQSPYLSEVFGKKMRQGLPPDLLSMQDDQWRQTRHIITPSFSSKKLKAMAVLVQDSCIALEERMQAIAKSGKSHNICSLFKEYTLETILATAFGHKVEVLRGDGSADTLTAAVSGFFSEFAFTGSTGIHMMMAIASNFQSLIPILDAIFGGRTRLAKHFRTILITAKALVQARRKMGSQQSEHKDFLQLMLEASGDDEDTSEDKSPPLASTPSKKRLTDDEVVITANMFLLAGYETTGSSLAFTAYLLAVNSDKQDQLCDAIDAFYEENEEASLYEAAQSIDYLDWTFQEALRIYPPGTFTTRYCKRSCTIGDLTIQEGAQVLIPIYTLQHSTEHWEKPEEFIPERFRPDEKAKREPFAHMPFGWGPRNCIGMRFALMEAKMALVHILRRFRFEKSSLTEEPLKVTVGINFLPLNGINLKVVPRD